jgi:hypothetical protein
VDWQTSLLHVSLTQSLNASFSKLLPLRQPNPTTSAETRAMVRAARQRGLFTSRYAAHTHASAHVFVPRAFSSPRQPQGSSAAAMSRRLWPRDVGTPTENLTRTSARGSHTTYFKEPKIHCIAPQARDNHKEAERRPCLGVFGLGTPSENLTRTSARGSQTTNLKEPKIHGIAPQARLFIL